VLLDVGRVPARRSAGHDYGDHGDAPGSSSSISFDRRCAPPQHHHLPPGLAPRSLASTVLLGVLHARSRFTAFGQTGHHTTHADGTATAEQSSYDPPRGRRSCRCSRAFSWVGMLEHLPGAMCIGNPTVNLLLPACGTPAFWARYTRTGAAEPDRPPSACASGGRSSTAAWTRRAPLSDRGHAAGAGPGRRAPGARSGPATAGQHL